MTASDALWSPAPADLVLLNNAVHVWRVPLDLTASCVQRLQQVLSADEVGRAACFYFPRDRQHFIVARGVLRVILGRYLGVEPRQLCFCSSYYRKPALLPTCGGERLRFNVSHSHQLALYAVTYGREVGIDIEYIRTNFVCEEIAERFFSPRENVALGALPAHLKRQAFFNCWTRKEAYIKAHGEGLSLPLDQFDVSLTPGEPAALLATRGDAHEASHWSLRELTPGPGYVGALAVEGHDWRLTCWQWRWEGVTV
jgi:4'-phosphopantetheinyl transferase